MPAIAPAPSVRMLATVHAPLVCTSKCAEQVMRCTCREDSILRVFLYVPCVVHSCQMEHNRCKSPLAPHTLFPFPAPTPHRPFPSLPFCRFSNSKAMPCIGVVRVSRGGRGNPSCSSRHPPFLNKQCVHPFGRVSFYDETTRGHQRPETFPW